jgi:hypothetical protein
MRFRLAGDAVETAGAGDQPKQPQLERESGSTAFFGGGAGLVVDDRKTAVGRRSIRSARPWTVIPAMTASPVAFGPASGVRPVAAILALELRAIQSIASSSRGAHSARSIGWMVSSASNAPPAAEACRDRNSSSEAIARRRRAPRCPSRRRVVCVDRIDLAKLQDRLRIESERVGLQPVDWVTEIRSGRWPGGGQGSGRSTGFGGPGSSSAAVIRSSRWSRGKPPLIASSLSRIATRRSANAHRASP